MLHVNKREYVISYTEVIVLFLLFLGILIILNPRNMLEKQILAEKRNYDLTVAYLENMLRIDPNNTELILKLAKISFQSQNIDLANRLLNVLRNSDQTKHIKEVYLLDYNIVKNSYYTADSDYKKSLKKEWKKILHNIIRHKAFDAEIIETLYQDALYLKDYDTVLTLTDLMIANGTDTLEKVQNAYYITINLKQYDRAQKYLDILKKRSKKSVKWLEAQYYLYRYRSEHKKAKSLLLDLAKQSYKFKELLAQLYLQEKKYTKASTVYLELMNAFTSKTLQKEYLLKAISTLQAGNRQKDLVRLVKRYENRYLNDVQMTRKFMKIYLSADALSAASKLAKKRLRYAK